MDSGRRLCDHLPMMARRTARLARFAAVLFACAAPLATAIAANHIAMRFDVIGPLGVRVLTLRTQFEQSAGRYAVSIDYATTGIAGLIIDQKTYAVAHGRLAPGSALPETFRNHTRRNGVERYSRVSYYHDGRVEGSTTPPPSKPVAPAAAHGTVDNLSAYLRLERQLAATGTCALTVPVFDGRHRYDLVFTDGGQQTLRPRGGQNFAGVATACRMARHNRAVDEAEQAEGAQQGTIWYARLLPGRDLMLPVRMKLTTQIGTVDAYLAELQGPGVSLRVME